MVTDIECRKVAATATSKALLMKEGNRNSLFNNTLYYACLPEIGGSAHISILIRLHPIFGRDTFGRTKFGRPYLVQPKFGPVKFGPTHFWSNPFLVKPNLVEPKFGPAKFGRTQIWSSQIWSNRFSC